MHYRWSSISTVGVLIPFLALTLPACETSSGSAPRTAGEPRSTSTNATTSAQQATVPIVQERMQVGKRDVQSGTTRLEQRTNEQVTLHDEKVNVEQRATDHSFADAERAFKQSAGAQAWSTLEPDFRRNYRTTYVNAGLSYEQVQPAYRYGYELALNPQIGAADWNAIEPQAKQTWESRRKGSWDQYRDAVRYGWELTRRAKE